MEMNIHSNYHKFLPRPLSNYIRQVLESDINRYLIGGTFWSVISVVVSKILVIISTIFIARILGQTIYGELAILRSNINLFISFTGLGIALTATKYVAQYKDKDFLKTARIISLVESVSIAAVIFSTLLLLLLSGMLTSSVLNIPHLNVELKVSGLLLIFSVFTALQVGILSGFQQFKEIGKNTLIAGIIGFILQIPLTYYGSLSGALMGLSLNLILFWIFNFLSIRKIREGKYPIALFSKSSLSELPILWKFSLPTFLIAILMEATRWIANTKLISSSNGFKQMAIFDVSYQWQVSINILPAILAQVALPILSHNVDDKEKYSHIFYKNFKINAIIATSICAVFCLLSPFILSLYGNGYSQSYLVFIYMIICSTLAAVNSAVWQITVASEHMWVNLFINTFWSVALLFSVYMYVNRSGLTAERLSFSYLLAYMAQSILLVVYFFFYQNSVKTKN